MPILKPRISHLEDKRLGSNSMRSGTSNWTSQDLTNLDPSLLSLKSVHDSKHRWDYLKDHIGKPEACVNTWPICTCDTAIFIRGAEMGIEQRRIRALEDII